MLLRYLSPFACLLLGHRAVVWALSSSGGTLRWSGAAAAVSLLLGANILLSPEVAVAFALARFGYEILMARRDVRVLAVSLVALSLPAAVLDVVAGSTMARCCGSLKAPTICRCYPQRICSFTSSLCSWQCPAVGRRCARTDAGDIPAAAICGALGLCVVMAPGAQAAAIRPTCWPYGMGASALLMIRLANSSRRAFAVYTIAYAGVFIVLIQIVNLVVFYGVSPRALLSRDAIAHVTGQLWSATGTDRPDMATLSALDRYPRLACRSRPSEILPSKLTCCARETAARYYISVVGVYTEAL